MTDKIKSFLEDRLKRLESIRNEREFTTAELGDVACCKQTLAFIDTMQEEPKFKIGQTITDPDDSTFTFHINRIEDGKYIESDDAWVLIKDADEEYQLVEEPVSEDLEEVYEQLAENARKHKAETSSPFFSKTDYRQGVIDGVNWQEEQFEKNRLKHCNSITNEQAELEQGFIDQHLDKHQRMPTFLDAIEYGMQEMKQQMMKDAVDSCAYISDFKLVVQVCLPFGNKQRIHNCDKVRVIIIKED